MEPVQFGPPGVVVGDDIRLAGSDREALLEAIGGAVRLRADTDPDALFSRIERLIAEHEAWVEIPNDKHFAQPREVTQKELDAIEAAAQAMVVVVASASDETRARMGERASEHRMLWSVTSIRNRAWTAQADLAEEKRATGAKPRFAAHLLASGAGDVFEASIGRPTYSGNSPTSWQRFLERVFELAGAGIDSDDLARKIVRARRRNRPTMRESSAPRASR